MTILADGRRLWRVFDNLMNNICKYAQRGTRVYLTLEERDGQAVISFKNTSRAPLDIPAEELLERFVRGDAARGGEGNAGPFHRPEPDRAPEGHPGADCGRRLVQGGPAVL